MKLRFYISNNNEYIERKEDLKLNQLVNTARFSTTSNTIYYEIQDIAITEMEVKKFINIKFLNKHHQEQKTYRILIDNNATIEELLKSLRQSMKIEKLGKLRLYTVRNGRIELVYEDYNDIQSLESNSNSQEIYVEEIPEDQLVNDNNCKYIQILHFKNDISNYHSVPFIFKLNKDEKIIKIKERLQKSIGMNDKEFAKVKICYIQNGIPPRYFDEKYDNSVLYNGTEKIEGCIGLDYPCRNPNISSYEKAVKIHN